MIPLPFNLYSGSRAGVCGLLLTLSCATRPATPQRAADFPFPDILLVNQDGQKVQFKEHVPAREPLVVTFIYTTCTTVCPAVSTGFASLQARLGAESGRVRLVSITVDPEHDTPKVMKDYLLHFRAKPGWEFLTGSPGDIRRIRWEFDLRVPGPGPSMPICYLRSPKDGKWIRLAGPRTPSEFVAVCVKEDFP
jgi:protein SCO1/2